MGLGIYNPRVSQWLSVDKPLINGKYLNFEHHGGVLNSFNLGSYTYCRQSPIVLIDPDGNQYNNSIILKPMGYKPYTIRGRTYQAQVGYYQYTKPAAHLLGLVSGVREENILNAKVKFSRLGDAGASLATGSSTNDATITHYYSKYEYDSHTDGSSFRDFFKRNAHEVGHIPQLKDGNANHIAGSLYEYAQNVLSGQHWHGGSYSTKEPEADWGEKIFNDFIDFTDKSYGPDSLKNLFRSNSDEKVIETIDLWWQNFNDSNLKKDEKESNNQG